MARSEKVKVHDLASMCEDLDAFISHTWNSPWWQRYATLLLYFYWRRAAMVATATLLLFSALDIAGLMPTTTVLHDAATQFPLQEAYWAAAPSALGLLALLSGPYLHVGRLGDPNVFLDVVCINQVDESLKTEGIASLAGFLRSSKEMIVLWTPENMQRLWCVFEVAVFCKMKGPENIVWCPIFQYSTGLIIFCCAMLIEVVHFVREASGQNMPVQAPLVFTLVHILYVGLCVIVLHVGRAFMRSKTDFLNALPGLKCDDAKCRKAADREFILESIRHWYGSVADFNEYLRRSLSQHIMQAVTSMDVTYRFFIVCTYPALCFRVQHVIAYSRAGCDQLLVTMVLLNFGHPLLVMPIIFKLTWQVLYILRAHWQFKVVDLAMSMMATAVFLLGRQLSWMIVASLWESVWLALAYTVGCVLLTLLTFHTCACAEMGLPAKAASDHHADADGEGSGDPIEHADVEAPRGDADVRSIGRPIYARSI